MGGSSIAAFLLINMQEEIFKSVNGYEGYYEVSNLGRIKSCARVWSVGKKEATILKPAHRKGEYDSVTFCVDGVKKYLTIHRLVAIHFCDNPNNFPVVNHKDSDIYNNRADNLEWTTNSGNAIHGYKFGNREGCKGEKHGRRKLSEDQVMALIKRRNEGAALIELADDFKISIAQVSRIANGQRWSHI